MALTQKHFWTWRNVLIALALVLAVSALAVGYSLYRTIAVVIPHSYAAWTTGDLLVEFMQTHHDHWPSGWDDLAKARDSLVQKGRNIYWDFNKLPAIVKIDWNVDPPALAKAVLTKGESAVFVVTQKNGSKLEAKWGPDTEPNRKVALHLIRRFGSSNAMELPKTASATNIVQP